MSSDRIRVPEFKGDNYENWRFRLNAAIRAHDLFECIDKDMIPENPNRAWTKKDNKCMALIIEALNDM